MNAPARANCEHPKRAAYQGGICRECFNGFKKLYMCGKLDGAFADWMIAALEKEGRVRFRRVRHVYKVPPKATPADRQTTRWIKVTGDPQKDRWVKIADNRIPAKGEVEPPPPPKKVYYEERKAEFLAFDRLRTRKGIRHFCRWTRPIVPEGAEKGLWTCRHGFSSVGPPESLLVPDVANRG